MARLALSPPSAYGLRWRQRQPRHQVSAAWACARSSFRALKSKFPAAPCLIFIGTEGDAVAKLVEAAGGKLVAMYFRIHDGPGAQAIFDLPDPSMVASIASIIV